MRTGELQLRVLSHGTSHMLILTGELDLSSSPALEGQVRRLCEGGASEILLELNQVRFIDHAGLHAILDSKEACAGEGCHFGLICGSPAVQLRLDLEGFLDLLPFARRPLRKDLRAIWPELLGRVIANG
jgi:anti-anti-sigma factor